MSTDPDDNVSVASALTEEEEILELAAKSRAETSYEKKTTKEIVNEQVAAINAGRWNIPIDDKAGCSLALKLPECDADELRLYGRKLGPRAFAALCGALPRTRLVLLDLGGAVAGRIGAKTLAEALPRSTVKDLRLWNTRLRDPDIFRLAEALPRSAGQRSTLAGTESRMRGAQRLADALPSSKLLRLGLQANAIGDKGASALASALQASHIVYFDISQNKVGNVGVQKLAYATSVSKTLVDVWLRANAATPAAVHVLKQQPEHRHISWGLPPRLNQAVVIREETDAEKRAREQAEFEERRALSIADPSQKPNMPCACLSGLKYKKCCKLRYMVLMKQLEADRRRRELEVWANK